MKKTYMTPATEVTLLSGKDAILVDGSMNITGDTGHATFFDDNATGDGLSKRGYSVWEDDWSAGE